MCVRSEEIEVAGIVIGFDNRLDVAVRIDLFEYRLRHGLASPFPLRQAPSSSPCGVGPARRLPNLYPVTVVSLPAHFVVQLCLILTWRAFSALQPNCPL